MHHDSTSLSNARPHQLYTRPLHSRLSALALVWLASCAIACGSKARSGDELLPDAQAGTGVDGNGNESGGNGNESGGNGNESGGDVGNDGSVGDGGSSGSGSGGSDPGDALPGSGGLLADGGTQPGGGFITVGTGDDGELVALCGSMPCACSDGIDNDGDGLIDGFDSECTGPFDNDEGSFATGIPGDNRDPKWQDCFFDGNSGAGDDGCRYHTECLTGERDATDRSCSVAEACVDFCQPLTPPGCDCFGCCEVTHEGQTLHISIGDSCSMEELDDEGKCPRCTPNAACNNECGECELCFGKTLEDLPDSCKPQTPPPGDGDTSDDPGGDTSDDPGGDTSDDPGGDTGDDPGGDTGGDTGDDPTDGDGDTPPPNTCDSGLNACSSNADCGSNQYCSLGCCRTFVVIR